MGLFQPLGSGATGRTEVTQLSGLNFMASRNNDKTSTNETEERVPF